jgi:hypothetical protein
MEYVKFCRSCGAAIAYEDSKNLPEDIHPTPLAGRNWDALAYFTIWVGMAVAPCLQNVGLSNKNRQSSFSSQCVCTGCSSKVDYDQLLTYIDYFLILQKSQLSILF